ncbi:hypothetical protein ACBJ59_61145 [Nonomuraea sp. MTCD27]|uniref:hypothetical protein n=1 Tax=Nonomuraea sp. MTCD27 TaxID=1676747 RepID=UPI0035C18AE8
MTPPRICSRARAQPANDVHWRLRVNDALDAILATREDLTPIIWVAGRRGDTLVGLIEPDPCLIEPDPYLIERVFAEWQTSLGLTLLDREPGVLHAARTRRDGVRILLIAILPDAPRKDVR